MNWVSAVSGRFAGRWKAWLCLLMLLMSGVCQAQEGRPLRLGIMPFNSALALIKTHQPLRQHLETVLNRKVEIYTSADYYTFINELLAGNFDLTITGPHFGSMAVERGWVPLVRYQVELEPVLVVAKNSPLNQLSDLRGKRIGLSSRLSISSIGGVKWLQDRGLKLDADYQLFERTTHGAAVAAVVVGELDAAFTTYTPLKQLPEDIQQKVRILPLDIRVPHLMTMAHGRLGNKLINQIQGALQSFAASEAGGAFFKHTGYEGYRPVTAKDLQALKPYVSLTVQMMKGHQ